VQAIGVDCQQSRAYRFGAFRLKSNTTLLTLNDRPVQIPPRAFAVLRVLVEEMGGLVTKEDLIQRVWGGAFIEESNVTKSIAEIRRILRQGFRNIDPIRTVWKVGYRFDVPVTVDPFHLEKEPPTAIAPAIEPPPPIESPVVEPTPALAPTRPFSRRQRLPWLGTGLAACVAVAAYLPLHTAPALRQSRPRIGVLGIRNISSERSVDWLRTALAETLTSELLAGGGLLTISSERVAGMYGDLGLSAGATYDPVALRRVRSNLNCQLAVTGTYLVSGAELRVDLRIQDTATGEIRGIVSETGATDHLFDLVARIGADLRRTLGERVEVHAASAATNVDVDAGALRLYALGLDRLRVWDAPAALEYFTQALRTGDRYAPIHASLSLDWSLLGFDRNARDEAQRATQNSAGLPREQQLQIEARYAEMRADWPRAIETWRALWRFYPDQIDYAERLVTSLTMSGKPRDASAMLRTLRSTDPRLLLADSRAYYTLGDYAGAVGTATDAAAEARKSSARLMEARAVTVRGEALRRLSEFEKALEDFREAGRISNAIGDRSGAAQALLNEADVSRVLGKGDVEPLLLQAKSIAGEIGDRATTIRILASLSALHRSRADMAGAIQFTGQALALARETGNLDQEALNLNDLGNLRNNTGDPVESRAAYEQALARGTEIGNRRVMSLASGNLGILDFVSGRLPQATVRFERALKIKREIGDRDSIAYTLTFMGRVGLAAGRLADAHRYLQESEGILRSIHEIPAGPTIQLAHLAIAEGRSQDVEAPLTELAAKFTRPAPACEIWVTLAESWLARGHPERAREASGRALALAQQSPNRADFGIPADLVAAEVDISSGNFDKARQSLKALLAESHKLSHVPNELNVRAAIALLETRSGNTKLAAEYVRSLKQDAAQMGFGLIASGDYLNRMWPARLITKNE
jgi:DNA-binding winged helix-turn-helix (wHTH) protein/tetratricopeptide (TPR) repeat protein